jgi:hypothetical protein
MASSPSRSSSNWPTLFVAGLLVICTGGFVAHQKGWIPPVVWKRAHQVVLAISGQLPDPAANDAADSGTASLGEEVPDELDARLAGDDTPAQPDRVVRPKGRNRSREIPDDIYSDPEDASAEPQQPAPPPAPRRSRGSAAPRSTDADAALALADGEAFVDDVAERPAPKRPSPSRTPPNRSASVTEPARPAPPAVNEALPDGVTAPTGDLVEIADIEKLIAEEQDVLALQEMTRRYWKMPAERELLRPRMEELSNRIYFSPQPHYFEPHVIQNTEQLRQVAPKYSLSWQYLARLNNTDPKRIRPGQRLKVAPGPFHALVTIRSHELIIHNNGCYVKRYRIGAGKDRSTPIGTFKVLGKETNPTYYGPEGVVKADDPNNPLGERWIDIGNSFGVHGTNEPDSIGQDKSRGCIRMTNEDVAEVYDFLVIGSEVKIQR